MLLSYFETKFRFESNETTVQSAIAVETDAR